MHLTPRTAELLAPVGTWDVLEAVIAAGADAVYLGGKKHNMRMFRADFNFDDERLSEAIKYAHARDVKVYVTLNGLYTDEELNDIGPYLQFLAQANADALIVADLGAVQLIRKLGIRIPLHMSVMANTLNSETIQELADFGVSRIVLGREVSLSEAKRIRDETEIETEYFIHGDMCIAQSGQCLSSGMILGESSNRGRCLKPCRWPYDLADGTTGDVLPMRTEGQYLLAIKDMCMLGHIPQLLQADICSFKIEGRMRTAAYLADVVRVYRRAIDGYCADPVGYRLADADWQQLYSQRVRDFSTCFSFSNPGAASVGYTGEREPRFFSKAIREPVIGLSDLNPRLLEQSRTDDADGKPSTVSAHDGARHAPALAVRIGSPAALIPVLEAGAELVYAGGEQFRIGRGPENTPQPWTLDALAEAVETAHHYGAQLLIAAPRITMRREMDDLRTLFRAFNTIHPDGALVSSLGQLRMVRELAVVPVVADFGFNVLNLDAIRLLQGAGVRRATAELEASFELVAELAEGAVLPMEAIVHGPLPGMVLDHCLPAALLRGETQESCSRPCAQEIFDLVDAHDQRRPVRIDQYCRNHIFLANDVAMLPYLGSFVDAGLAVLRIEGQLYETSALVRIVALYAAHLERANANAATYHLSSDQWQALLDVSPRPLGFGAYKSGLRQVQSKINSGADTDIASQAHPPSVAMQELFRAAPRTPRV